MTPTTLAPRVSASDYRRADPVAEAARTLGMTPASVHQLMYGRDNVFHRSAVIVAELVKAGQRCKAERLLAKIDRARAESPAPILNDELCEQNQAVEQAEDRREARFFRHPSAHTARLWRDELRREIAHNQEVIRALEAYYEIS